MEVLFPEEIGNEEEFPEATGTQLNQKRWEAVPANKFGYLQNVDTGSLQSFARENDLILRLEQNIGDFVSDGAALVSADRPLEKESARVLRALFVVGDFRTTEQDAAFGIRQIVDIAMKALSPGVNDTSTAVSCLDYLSVILSLLAQRRVPQPMREQDGKLRVIAPAPKFADYVAKAFDEIRLSAAGNVTILLQMLSAIRRVGAVTTNAGRCSTLLQHARLVSESADHMVPAPYDRQRINGELILVREVLHAGPAVLPVLREDRAAIVAR